MIRRLIEMTHFRTGSFQKRTPFELATLLPHRNRLLSGAVDPAVWHLRVGSMNASIVIMIRTSLCVPGLLFLLAGYGLQASAEAQTTLLHTPQDLELHEVNASSVRYKG